MIIYEFQNHQHYWVVFHSVERGNAIYRTEIYVSDIRISIQGYCISHDGFGTARLLSRGEQEFLAESILDENEFRIRHTVNPYTVEYM